MQKMTSRRLLAVLRSYLARADTRVTQRRLKICGHTTYLLETSESGEQVPREITICLDPRRDGRVRVVIHELLHVWADITLKTQAHFTYQLEEAAILAWESRLYALLQPPSGAKHLESWDRAITRKIT